MAAEEEEVRASFSCGVVSRRLLWGSPRLSRCPGATQADPHQLLLRPWAGPLPTAAAAPTAAAPPPPPPFLPSLLQHTPKRAPRTPPPPQVDLSGSDLAEAIGASIEEEHVSGEAAPFSPTAVSKRGGQLGA